MAGRLRSRRRVVGWKLTGSLIEYTLKIHDEGTSLTNAYNQATEEFVALRAKYEMTTMAAELEARHWGARFDRTPFVRDSSSLKLSFVFSALSSCFYLK